MSRLTQAEIGALHEALDDEYKAWTTYDQVIHDFGPERPFIHIVESEARHIEALRTRFERYGVVMPGNPWAGRAPRFTSTREACQAGVEAEVENAALCDRLMRTTHREDRHRSSRLASLRPEDQQARPDRGRRSC